MHRTIQWEHTTLNAEFVNSLFVKDQLTNSFKDFPLPDLDDPSLVRLPPDTLEEANESLRILALQHSYHSLKTLDNKALCDFHLQPLLPGQNFLQSLTTQAYYSILAINIQCFTQELLDAKIFPQNPLYSEWMLKARGYTEEEYLNMDNSAVELAVSGIPLSSPRLPNGSRDLLLYFIWTRRQFLIYIISVNNWVITEHPEARLSVQPKFESTWAEPLTDDECAYLRRFSHHHTLAFQQIYAECATMDGFSQLKPHFDIDLDITRCSIDHCYTFPSSFPMPLTAHHRCNVIVY